MRWIDDWSCLHALLILRVYLNFTIHADLLDHLLVNNCSVIELFVFSDWASGFFNFLYWLSLGFLCIYLALLGRKCFQRVIEYPLFRWSNFIVKTLVLRSNSALCSWRLVKSNLLLTLSLLKLGRMTLVGSVELLACAILLHSQIYFRD